MSNAFVVCMGIATVFFGLLCIIILCRIVSAICMTAEKKAEDEPTVSAPTATPAPEKIENRQEIIAAISAAIAEELGTDISAIRILSFKKI